MAVNIFFYIPTMSPLLVQHNFIWLDRMSLCQAYIAKPMRKSDLVEVMLTFGCGRLSPAVLQAARILVSDSRVESSCPEYIGSQLRILLVEDQQVS